jgi:hypothetical protein
VSVLLLSAIAVCAPSSVCAQESALALDEETQKPIKIGAEVFGGYSGYRPGGSIEGVRVADFKAGWDGQFTLTLDRWAGVVADVSGHYAASSSAYNLTFGPRVQLPLGHFKPFAEALTGGQHLSPKGFPSGNKAAYIFGGGLDVKVNSAFSIRPFELSYVSTRYSVLPTSLQPKYSFSGFMAQAGLVYNLRLSSSKGVLASCTAEPSAVDAGGKVKIGVTPKGFPPKRRLSYSYATTGGIVSGSSAGKSITTLIDASSIDTTGVWPGSYTVTAKVVDDGKGRHQQTASCRVQFSVNAKQTPQPVADEQPQPVVVEQLPPVAAGQPGDAWAATDKAQTPLKVSTPQPSKFGTIEFKHDSRRPTRVDNEAKGELDRYADALAMMPDVTGVVVARAEAKDCKENKNVLNVASQRAANIKEYVAKEKGIDPGRIETRAGSGDGRITELWILPAAGTFAAEGTQAVDGNKARAAVHEHAHKKRHKTVR